MSIDNAADSGVVFRPKQSRFLRIPQSSIPYWPFNRFFNLMAEPRFAGKLKFERELPPLTTIGSCGFIGRHLGF